MPHGPRFQQLAADAKAHIREITAQQAAAEQQAGALLIDVRESDEFTKEHATGAIPMSRGTLELKIEEKAPDAATPIICYCGGGSRSALSAESLKRMGYTNVSSLAGGFKAWKDANLPTAT
ncbi:MAG TPA: rhodanese-like domain-containing protein [Pirellulaceae bacterium]|jgi:rhodanese-related sulfurtransferase